jgi:hypothetical protein
LKLADEALDVGRNVLGGVLTAMVTTGKGLDGADRRSGTAREAVVYTVPPFAAPCSCERRRRSTVPSGALTRCGQVAEAAPMAGTTRRPQ